MILEAFNQMDVSINKMQNVKEEIRRNMIRILRVTEGTVFNSGIAEETLIEAVESFDDGAIKEFYALYLQTQEILNLQSDLHYKMKEMLKNELE